MDLEIRREKEPVHSADVSGKEQGGKLSPLVNCVCVCVFKWNKKIGCLNQQNAENKLVCKMGINKHIFLLLGKKVLKKGTSLKQDSFVLGFLLFTKYGKTVAATDLTEVKQMMLLGSHKCTGFRLCWLLKIKQLPLLFSIPYYILNTLKYLKDPNQNFVIIK